MNFEYYMNLSKYEYYMN